MFIYTAIAYHEYILGCFLSFFLALSAIKHEFPGKEDVLDNPDYGCCVIRFKLNDLDAEGDVIYDNDNDNGEGKKK